MTDEDRSRSSGIFAAVFLVLVIALLAAIFTVLKLAHVG